MTAPVVELDCGRIRGRRRHGILRFEGVPYARPPVGPLRFRPPLPVAPWSGMRNAETPRPGPLQLPGPSLGSRPVGATSEDCLYINVATPALSGSRPVLVWIYGGGFVNGSAADPIHAGDRLVAVGDVVLVTFDYRLGVFGFLHDPSDPGESNLGVRDQLAALDWVRRHIAAFGGDPSRVTLFGESAGAMCLLTLMGTPAADHLFHAGVVQSGAANWIATPEAAERTHAAFAAEVGSTDRETWRALPAARMLEAQQRIDARIRAETGRGAFRPLLDGVLIEHDGQAAQARPINRSRPLILGSNRDEQRLFLNLRRPLEREAAVARLAHALRPHSSAPKQAATALLEGYAGLAPAWNTVECLAAAETELHYRLPLLRLAGARDRERAPSWIYLFAWASPALRGRLGACHALEIPFVFGTLDAPGMARFAGDSRDAWRLSERMQGAWSAFAHHHDPRTAVPQWLPWTPEQPWTWKLDAAPDVILDPFHEVEQLWQQVVPGLMAA